MELNSFLSEDGCCRPVHRTACFLEGSLSRYLLFFFDDVVLPAAARACFAFGPQDRTKDSKKRRLEEDAEDDQDASKTKGGAMPFLRRRHRDMFFVAGANTGITCRFSFC